jgi:hypothetical protein
MIRAREKPKETQRTEFFIRYVHCQRRQYARHQGGAWIPATREFVTEGPFDRETAERKSVTIMHRDTTMPGTAELYERRIKTCA